MDDIRDLQRANSLSKYVDGHPVRTSPFGGNKAAERLYSRCERISIAIHLLTSHIDAREPVRIKLRGSALELLDSALELREEMRSPESSSVANFVRIDRSIISLVRSCAAAGYISINNADILCAALDELGSFIGASQRSNFAENISLTKEDLMGPVSPLSDTSRMSFIKDIKDRGYVRDRVQKGTSVSVSDRVTGPVQLNARSQAILQILSGGREYGIKDICGSLPEYSEKMVQRELADLVRDGKVKKEGSKRWSRYSLVAAIGQPAN